MSKKIFQGTRVFGIAAVMLFLLYASAESQQTPPKEHVPESGILSLSGSTPFNVALKALNEYSMRLERKPIIDTFQRTNPINIDIVNLTWRTALELIVSANHLEYVETDTYIQIVQGQTAAGVQESGEQSQASALPLKAITSGLREIRLSAKFFEADKKSLKESGINLMGYFSRGNVESSGQTTIAGTEESVAGGSFEIAYSDGRSSLSAVLKALESNDVGDVIASPQITTIDGRKGRVQVGQDFSIKQRDFAGNVLDYFVSAGVILTVTPHIVDEDSIQFIYLKIEAERSSAQPGAVTTIINKTEAATELFLNDGEEVLIGGLNSTEEYHSRSGIPLLRDIPKWCFGLGYLFGYEKTDYSEKELIVLIKAEIVPTLEERLRELRSRNGG